MFKKGDKVVYPMHGAGVIDGIEEKEILGEKKKYYILHIPHKEMKVMIPVDNVEALGVRQIADEETFNEVIELLGGDRDKMPTNWNKRYRQNMEKMKTGDIIKVANVVKNLTLMDHEKGLSTGERKMLHNSKQILVSELALSSDKKEEEIADLIEDSIH